MARIITVGNQKGGAGKTTQVVAGTLARKCSQENMMTHRTNGTRWIAIVASITLVLIGLSRDTMIAPK